MYSFFDFSGRKACDLLEKAKAEFSVPPQPGNFFFVYPPGAFRCFSAQPQGQSRRTGQFTEGRVMGACKH